MRRINEIIVHCSATLPGQKVTVADIDRWHRQRGWRKIGYHYVVRENGYLEVGRYEWEIGAHTAKGTTRTASACAMWEDWTSTESLPTRERKHKSECCCAC